MIFQASHGIKNGSLFDPFIIQTDTFQTSGMEKEAGGRQITHNRVIKLLSQLGPEAMITDFETTLSPCTVTDSVNISLSSLAAMAAT